MKRRDYLCAAASGLLLLRCPALAETAERVYRVGILRPSPPPLPDDKTANGIPDALRELGYLEGRNIVIERLYADGKPERLPGLVGELLKAKVEVVIAVSSPAVQAVRAASATLPIVMYGNFDPVALGLVASLARPGGNVTGVLIAPDGYLAGKRLELLKAAVPQATRFAYLGPPADPSARLQLVETKKAAASLGIEVADVEVRNGDYERAFVAIAAQRPEALFVAAHTLFVRDRMQIIQLAAKYKLPATYEWREQVADGGLMTYSTSLSWIYQRLASYVDRLLKGAKPGDLPIERPTKFELVINLKTARALGLAIPRSLLLRADEVIG